MSDAHPSALSHIRPALGDARAPRSLTPFVGRLHEVAAVAGLLRTPGVRLVTLTGPGGVGKTRLALQVANATTDAFADGVAFISLAEVADPTRVIPAIARSLGIRERGGEALRAPLVRVLRDRQQLLVLDNVEQIVAAAPAIADVLAACPRLTVLVTSRIALRVTGEHEFPVPPLALPSLTDSLAAAGVVETEAVSLFVQHARFVRPGFALTADNAEAIAEICRRVDGLPLAIELAAARVKVLAPTALLARLTHRLQVLTSGPRDLPPRQQTMRAAIAWSDDLLAADERSLLRRLAVFAGGFTLEAAEAVCAARVPAGRDQENQDAPGRSPSPGFILDGLTSLVDQSLVRPMAQADDEPRFAMLETIREYALERLSAAGEAAAAREAHSGWMANLIELPNEVYWGPDQQRWLDRFELEHDNLRAALAWSLDNAPARALRIAERLWWFWQTRGYLAEGRQWLERAIAVGTDAPPMHRADARFGASFLATMQGDWVAAQALAEAGSAIARDWGDRRCIARGLYMLSLVGGSQGDHATAEHQAAAAVAIFRETGDDLWLPFALNRCGIERQELGDWDGAEALFREALAGWRQRGLEWGIATALANLAHCARAHGEDARAAVLYREGLPYAHRYGDTWGVIETLTGLAGIAAAHGQAEIATRLFATADAVRTSIGLTLQHYVQAAVDRALAAVRTELGDARFTAAWEAGRNLSLAQAVMDTAGVGTTGAEHRPIGAAATAATKAGEPPNAVGLTGREIEVLRLLAEGRSSREIGEELFISPRTATTHVTNIFTKLCVDNRAAAVAKAFQLGIL